MTTEAGLLASVVAAVITASVAVFVAALTQWKISQREQRTEDRRRATLLDAQDAAVALRGRLHDYGMRLRTAVDGRLAAYLVRVEDRGTVPAIEAWRAAANARFISTAETSVAEEDDAWRALNTAVGAALQSVSPPSRRRARAG